jgi:hypothetical protein
MKEMEKKSFRYDAFNSCFSYRIGKQSEGKHQEKELVVPITGKKPKSGKGNHGK